MWTNLYSFAWFGACMILFGVFALFPVWRGKR